MGECCNQCCNHCCDNISGGWFGGNSAWIIIAIIVIIWLFCGSGSSDGNCCC